jgi:hypothetical protein
MDESTEIIQGVFALLLFAGLFYGLYSWLGGWLLLALL